MHYSDAISIFNVFKYISLRCILAIITSMSIVLFLGPYYIKLLKTKFANGQPIRDDGPETHFSKVGTPTMGGLLMLAAIFVSAVLWMDLSNVVIAAVLTVLFGFGILGFFDDYKKLTKNNTGGISGRMKLFWQFAISALVTYSLMQNYPSNEATLVTFPFIKTFALDIGIFYTIFGAFVIAGSSNAVNLTDGLDGLAIGPIIIACMCLALISYIVGHSLLSEYLFITHIANTSELAVCMSAIIGAGLGFLWFNSPPAQIFMGDVGSLSLGGAIGATAVAIKHETTLAIIGGLFVIEALSVMVQVGSYKLRNGKRVFKMAPIHHHFEKLGWPETKVVIRFWIIALVFGLLGIATLKLR